MRKLEEEFIRFYRQGRYAQAVKKAQQALGAAQVLINPRHPYHVLLRNNLRCAREAFLKYSPASNCSGSGISPPKDNFCREGSAASRNRTGVNLSFAGGLPEAAKQPQAGSKRWLVAGILVALFSLTGFLGSRPASNNRGQGIPLPVPIAKTEFALENEAAVPAVGKEFQGAVGDPADQYVLQPEACLEVPLIRQNPELPRGCEVTCLAMLLQYAGISVDKMALAAEVKKDPTPYQVRKGQIYFGNPHDGFVGDMYTLKKPGYGVYHGPIRELLENYLPGRTIDLTGCAFEDILLFISEGVPVWVVANATYAPLSDWEFQTWHTPQGPLKISYREHAVLLSGYDAGHVYFNDPLSAKKNKRAARSKFRAAWEQMGSQAVTYLPY